MLKSVPWLHGFIKALEGEYLEGFKGFYNTTFARSIVTDKNC
jgi:hypothetical protein